MKCVPIRPNTVSKSVFYPTINFTELLAYTGIFEVIDPTTGYLIEFLYSLVKAQRVRFSVNSAITIRRSCVYPKLRILNA
jgi:hypothetical protein